MIGRTYLLRGETVTVLARWGAGGGPRNVLIQRADGSRVVRPFRGLRRVQPSPGAVGNDQEVE
jgi:acetyl esterase